MGRSFGGRSLEPIACEADPSTVLRFLAGTMVLVLVRRPLRGLQCRSCAEGASRITPLPGHEYPATRESVRAAKIGRRRGTSEGRNIWMRSV